MVGRRLAGPAPAFGIAEDAPEDDIEEILSLSLGRLAPAGEVVGEDRAVEQVADDVGDPLDGDVANPTLGDQDLVLLPPAGDVLLAVFKVSRLLPVLEEGTLLNQEFDEFRVLGEE